MANLIVELSKYLIILFMAVYTFACFSVFRYSDEESRNGIYIRQNVFMFLIHFVSFAALCIEMKDGRLILFYALQQITLFGVIVLYRVIYPNANRLIVNNMCLLLTIGFIILTRLSYDKAVRQFEIAIVSLAVTMLIPFALKKFKYFDKFYWLYAAVGIVSLAVVMLFSGVVNGSKLNVTIANHTFQPSEFVKIIFVFAIAGMLTKSTEFKQVVLSAAVAGLHVIILVLSKDLGSAVIFFVVYFAMLYVATKKIGYYLLGFAGGSIAAVIGYRLFSHVRVRVQAWKDPIGTIEEAGYQISQSLFAIGTGGWFGMGLGQGAPNKIPVVEADFVFSAITEEFGVIFGMCLILVCVSCFVMFMNISMRFKNKFYKLVAVGLAVIYGFQVFLTIGGVTKFIPLTGVTLPLVSYGGSSVIVSLIMFAVIQGLYISVRDEIRPPKKKE
ncbi:MAG: FtsW/RodA/SpoVE family cell cycle protein [Lachnospiraceae bacterium]